MTDSDAGALGRLADALRRESPWPGFHPGQWPLLVIVGDHALLRGHPELAADAIRVVDPPLGVQNRYRGVPTACVEDGPDAEKRIWEAAFRLHLRHRLHRLPPTGMPDPDPSPLLAAMAEMEELVRAEALAATPERLPRAIRTLCLIRRERRGQLPDEQAEWEDASEVWEGLPAYVAGSSPRNRWARAGAAAAQQLDGLEPGWQRAWEGGRTNLHAYLERYVRFDAGEGDEALVLGALARHGYPLLLAAARDRIAAARTARNTLFNGILRGEGSLLVVDTSALGEGFVEAAQAGQPVNAGMSVYAGDVAFRYRGAEVFFHDVPVAQDRRAGLLQARVRGQLRMSGDGQPLQSDAAFSERLELVLPGVSVRARAGSVRPIDAGLYVKLEPPR